MEVKPMETVSAEITEVPKRKGGRPLLPDHKLKKPRRKPVKNPRGKRPPGKSGEMPVRLGTKPEPKNQETKDKYRNIVVSKYVYKASNKEIQETYKVSSSIIERAGAWVRKAIANKRVDEAIAEQIFSTLFRIQYLWLIVKDLKGEGQKQRMLKQEMLANAADAKEQRSIIAAFRNTEYEDLILKYLAEIKSNEEEIQLLTGLRTGQTINVKNEFQVMMQQYNSMKPGEVPQIGAMRAEDKIELRDVEIANSNIAFYSLENIMSSIEDEGKRRELLEEVASYVYRENQLPAPVGSITEAEFHETEAPAVKD